MPHCQDWHPAFLGPSDQQARQKTVQRKPLFKMLTWHHLSLVRINAVSLQSIQGVFMPKVRVNITIDEDLSKFLKGFSLSQRLSMSELINQWVLGLKRAQENQGMQTVLSSPEFYQSLLTTLEKTRTGEMKWHSREEVF